MTISKSEARALETYSVDLVTALFDSFAARVRDQARHARTVDVQDVLINVAGAAEEVAEQARKELAARTKRPDITIRDGDRSG